MRAMVISGGGSKGAFAGGVAQYLIDEMGYDYDILIGTSTGSLLISHLALNKIDKIRNVFTSVDERSIFNNYPFTIKNDKVLGKQIGINHFNVLKSFLKRKKTFGESFNLRKLISETLTEKEFEKLKYAGKELVVTVSNLSLNQVEYKSIKDFEYKDFCDWIWISSNYVPFMSLVEKNKYEYADGGFGCMVPIEEAISRGAKIIDVIVLETEVRGVNITATKNVFSLITNLYLFMMERNVKQNIRIGKLMAANKEVMLNFYYTPTELTTNSLIFDTEKTTQWWKLGFEYARLRNKNCNDFRIN
jgi:predicted patatin/cPLA2 family phospholipase